MPPTIPARDLVGLLEEAARALVERGWTAFQFEDGHRLSVDGALAVAAGGRAIGNQVHFTGDLYELAATLQLIRRAAALILATAGVQLPPEQLWQWEQEADVTEQVAISAIRAAARAAAAATTAAATTDTDDNTDGM